MRPVLVSSVGYLAIKRKPGVYAFYRSGRIAYVGRSDADLGTRLIRSLSEGYGYTHVWCEYASSSLDAYRQECLLYHKYRPEDNTAHPAVTAGTYWRCPVQGCPWSGPGGIPGLLV
jgi:hypothetical protein